jgi:hypothetical protein
MIDKNSTVLVKRVAAPRGSVGLLARLKANTPLTPQNMYVLYLDGDVERKRRRRYTYTHTHTHTCPCVDVCG